MSFSIQVAAQENPPRENSPATSADPAQLRDAIKSYEALNGSPDSSPSKKLEIRTRLAIAYFKLHQCNDSLAALDPFLSQTKNSANKASGTLGPHEQQVEAQAWLVAGLDYLELNRPSEAIPVLRRSLAVDANSANARMALGDALARTRHFEGAAKEYSDQAQRSPALPDAWYKLGLAYSASASDLLAAAESRADSSVVAAQLLAEELLNKGSNLKAARILFRILRDAPAQPDAHADLGQALLELGFPNSAEKQLRAELAIDPDSPLAMLDLGQVAALRQDWQEASAQLERAAGLQPNALRRLLEFSPAGLLRQGWIDKKITPPASFGESPAGLLWTAWLNSSDADEIVIRNASSTAKNCGALPNKKAATLGSWLPEACYETLRTQLHAKRTLSADEKIKLIEAEFRLGHYEVAVQQSKQLRQAEPNNDWATYWLAKSRLALADVCFAKVATLNPDSVRVHQMLAQEYTDETDYPKAKAEYEAAIRLAPDLPDLHLGLGIVYWRTSDWPQAEKELRTTVELTPGSPMARWRLGNTLMQESRWNEAIDLLGPLADDRAVGLNARLDLSKSEAALGQTSQAIDELLPILDQDQDGEIHFRLAALYKKSGDEDKARQALQSFRKLRAASLQASRDDLDALDAEQAEQGNLAPDSDPKPSP